jgi:hypothetical protein
MSTPMGCWCDQDMAELLALEDYRATLCPCCGLPKAITQVHEKDAPQFVVTRKVCWARKTLNQVQAVVENDKKVSDAHKRSLQWSITAKGQA